MGLAYSNGPIRYEAIPASPPEDFIAALDPILLDCGWVKLGTYGDLGFEYLITSPGQTLRARCRIWFPDDAAWPDCLALQFLSAVNPAIEGFVHHFVAGFTNMFPEDDRGFSQYAVWADVCQIFIGAVHPRSWELFPRAVQGGVPFASGKVEATPMCAAQTPPPSEATNELWWSAGDDSGVYDEIFAPGSSANFRNSYFCQKFSFCHNQLLVNAEIGSPTIPTEANALQVAIVRSAINWNSLVKDWPYGFVYPDMSPLANNPLLVYNATIYGELWDAVLISRPMDLGETEQIHETDLGRTTNWVNYMNAHGVSISTFEERNEGKCASILLLLEAEPVEVEEMNVAH